MIARLFTLRTETFFFSSLDWIFGRILLCFTVLSCFFFYLSPSLNTQPGAFIYSHLVIASNIFLISYRCRFIICNTYPFHIGIVCLKHTHLSVFHPLLVDRLGILFTIL
ncbi:hypothetical protein F5888DRAFT_817785 [Russula emetica]|nr:hypothetical protein F5888DRAFT_817785 [Russula emetica]